MVGPTWSLAIEEQYYFLWAPLVRFLRRPWMLALLLTGALVGSPLFRLTHFAWITPTHTLTHLDGIAMGSLLALGLYTLPLSRRTWLILGLVAIPTGFLAAAAIRGRHGVSGLSPHHRIRRSRSTPLNRFNECAKPDQRLIPTGTPCLLRTHQLWPLHDALYHGLRLLRSWFDARMDQYGLAGNLAVVAFRLVACTAVASALWYGFESQILKLKRHF